MFFLKKFLVYTWRWSKYVRKIYKENGHGLLNMFIPLQALATSSVNSPSTLVFWIAPIAGVIAVLASLLLMRHIGKMSAGGPKAQEVGAAIREGAYAFLKRQYTTIAIITVVVFVLLWVALPSGFLGLGTAAAFLSRRSRFIGSWLHSHGQRDQSERSHRSSGKRIWRGKSA